MEVGVESEAYVRPTTIPDLQARFENFRTAEGAQFAAAFEPNPDDVFIVTPPKCGTTWLQQIVQSVRSGCSMDFSNINDAVPWLGMTPVQDPRSAGEQAWHPRAFKTHDPLDRVPIGGRYVVGLRDPCDALVSHYRFFAGSFLDADVIDLDTFARDFSIPGRELVDHVLAAWGRRHDDDVLIVCFEDLKSDLPVAVDRVVEFIQVTCDQDRRDEVVRQAGLEFMRHHVAKFDDSDLFESLRHRMQLPPPSRGLTKVRTGHVGGGAGQLNEGVRAALAKAWTTQVTSVTGLSSYDELRNALATTRRSASPA
jgi:Sulfotransferase domain